MQAGLTVPAPVSALAVDRSGRPDQSSPVRRRLERQPVIFNQMLCHEPCVTHREIVRH